MSAKQTLLIVDDNLEHLAGLKSGFAKSGYEVITAPGGTEALEAAQAGPVDVIVTDLKMPDMTGAELLAKVRNGGSGPQVIIITAFGTVESAVETLQKGAFTYLTKPINLKELRLQVAKAMEFQAMKQENLQLKQEISKKFGFEGLIGGTREMHDMIGRLRAIADTRATVLIEGESGTGKELVARAIHRNSSRANKAFIPIHCAALSESLIESELFGHEKGAFTGAAGRRQGLFELADGGTIFLDEVGEIPLSAQVKLLRVLETREFLRVGGSESVKVDVRVLAATNRSLAEEAEEGRFREDLFYRLNVVRIELPPLRARASDIPLLVERFLAEFCEEHAKPPLHISREALDRLVDFPWPGNVRQLRNIVENLVLFSRGEELTIGDLPDDLSAKPSETIAIRIGEPLDQVERKMIERALVVADGNRTRAAELLGISRRTLLRKINELQLDA